VRPMNAVVDVGNRAMAWSAPGASATTIPFRFDSCNSVPPLAPGVR
jgi:hypothetical protein